MSPARRLTPAVAQATAEVRGWAEGHWRAIPLLTAERLGLFARLARGAKTPAQLKRALGADRRALDRLLEALLGLGLLKWEGERLALAPRYRAVLDPQSPHSLNAILAQHAHLHEAWAKLEPAVLDGPGEVLPLDAQATDPTRRRDFNHAMRALGEEGARELARAFRFRKSRRVLDVGGGPAAVALAICQRHRNLEWTVLERPNVLPLARRHLRGHTEAKRIALVPGDALEAPWPEGHDTVLLSQVVRGFPPGDVERLIARAAEALPPDGHLLIRDLISPSAKVPDERAGLMGINVLLTTPAGQMHTLPDLRKMLRSRFRVEGVATEDMPVLIARKR